MLRQKLIVEFDKNAKADIQKKVIAVRREGYHASLNQKIARFKYQIKSYESFDNKTLVRRAEVIKRHRKASGISETQKLLEDELQVLREFNKTVMKQKLTLQLELDGVKLPTESQK